MSGPTDLRLVESDVDDDELILVIELPAPLDLANSVLTVLGRRWPNATVTTTNRGWRVRIRS